VIAGTVRVGHSVNAGTVCIGHALARGKHFPRIDVIMTTESLKASQQLMEISFFGCLPGMSFPGTQKHLQIFSATTQVTLASNEGFTNLFRTYPSNPCEQ
jgi:hypothetical protein